MNSIKYTGDPHNFQKRVNITEDKYIMKPRCSLWEYEFLSNDGSIRRLLKQKSIQEFGHDLFAALPQVMYYNKEDLLQSSVLEKVILDRCVNLDDYECLLIGAVIGLCAWFGMSDLHKNNIVFGRDSTGKLKFGPIDIECIFDNFALPSQTHLMPTKDFKEKNCGLIDIVKILDRCKISSMGASICLGYIDSVRFLEEIEEEISCQMSVDCYKKAPIRVITKQTSDYKKYISGCQSLNDVMCKSEVVQLSRGDIPYYFRLLDSQNLYYYTNKLYDFIPIKETELSYLTTSIEKPKIYHKKLTRNPHHLTLLKAGTLQLSKLFCRNIRAGSVNRKKIRLNIDDKKIFIYNHHIGEVLCLR